MELNPSTSGKRNVYSICSESTSQRLRLMGESEMPNLYIGYPYVLSLPMLIGFKNTTNIKIFNLIPLWRDHIMMKAFDGMIFYMKKIWKETDDFIVAQKRKTQRVWNATVRRRTQHIWEEESSEWLPCLLYNPVFALYNPITHMHNF